MKNPFKRNEVSTAEQVGPAGQAHVKGLSESSRSESMVYIRTLESRIDELCNDIDDLRKQINRVERKVYRSAAARGVDSSDIIEDNSTDWLKGLK